MWSFKLEVTPNWIQSASNVRSLTHRIVLCVERLFRRVWTDFILTRRAEQGNVCTAPSERRMLCSGNVTCSTTFVLKTSICAPMAHTDTHGSTSASNVGALLENAADSTAVSTAAAGSVMIRCVWLQKLPTSVAKQIRWVFWLQDPRVTLFFLCGVKVYVTTKHHFFLFSAFLTYSATNRGNPDDCIMWLIVSFTHQLRSTSVLWSKQIHLQRIKGIYPSLYGTDLKEEAELRSQNGVTGSFHQRKTKGRAYL